MYTAGRTFRELPCIALKRSRFSTDHSVSQTLPTGTPIENPSDPAHSGRVHMAKIARTNFQKVVDVLGNLQTYWGGARYIRSVLVQKGEGAAQVSLVGEAENDTASVPPGLSEWIVSAATEQSTDSEHPTLSVYALFILADCGSVVMGLSFSGTMHSPTDSRFSVVYPPNNAPGLQ